MRGRRLEPYILMLPALLLIALVAIYPIGEAVRWSLHRTSYMSIVEFTGLKNYKHLLSDSRFWANLRTSAIYVFGSLLFVIPFSTSLALALTRIVRGRRLLRTILILPWVTSQTVAALLWRWLVNADFGPISYLYTLILGGVMENPFASRLGAMLVLIIANSWLYYPFAMVLILAALQTVPEEVYEAALVDGASRTRTWWSITFPIIQPTIGVTLVLLTLEFFNMVTLGYTLTGGGPFSATELISIRTFKEAFEFWNVGVASALSVMLFIANSIFGLAYIRIMRADT